MPYDIGHMNDNAANPRLAASMLAAASKPTLARALAAYDAALAGSNEFTLEDAAHLMAAVLRAPKASRAAKAPAGPADALVAALKLVTGAMERRNTIPIVSMALLTLKGGNLEIRGTDLDREARTIVQGVQGPDFSACVDPWRLSGLVKGARSLEFEPGDGVLGVIVNGSRAMLPTLPPGDFPVMADLESPVCAMVDSALLRDALAFLTPYISSEETRYYLNGVALSAGHAQGEARTYFSATDGHRLARQWAPAFAWEGDHPECLIIPKASVAWLVANLPDDGEVMVEYWEPPRKDGYAQGGGRLDVTLPNGVYRAKMIDGNFPDVARVIPDYRDASALVEIEDAKAFAAELGRIASVSTTKSRYVSLTVAGEVEACSRDMEGGRVCGMLPATSTGDATDLGFNATYLAAMVSAPGTLHLFGADSPALMHYAGRDDRLAVIMPLRG